MMRSKAKRPPAAGEGGSGRDDPGFGVSCRSAAVGCVTAARDDALTRRIGAGRFGDALEARQKVFSGRTLGCTATVPGSWCLASAARRGEFGHHCDAPGGTFGRPVA